MAVDVEVFTKHLRAHALKNWGKGKCGQWVREALQAGGAEMLTPYPATGKQYGPSLLRLGFRRLTVENPDTFNFQKGDVMVMEPYTGGKPAGHVAGYDGRNWISDFIQHDFWAGPGYRKERPSYAVYRP